MAISASILLLTLGLCFHKLQAETGQNANLAKEYHEHGLYLEYEHHKVEDSLPFYRAATRLAKNMPQYWFDLGNVEDLLNMKEKAKGRFATAYSLDESFEEAGRRFNQKLSDSVSKDITDAMQQISLEDMQEVNMNLFESPVKLDFNHLRPAVFRKADRYLGIDRANLQHHRLNAKYATETTEAYPQNMRQKPSRFYTMTLNETISFVEHPALAFASVDASSSGMYVQWNLNSSLFHSLIRDNTVVVEQQESVSSPPLSRMYSLLDLPYSEDSGLLEQCLPTAALVDKLSNLLHWYMVTLAEEKAGMFFHEDHLPTSSWQLQLEGRKSWVICPPLPPVEIAFDDEDEDDEDEDDEDEEEDGDDGDVDNVKNEDKKSQQIDDDRKVGVEILSDAMSASEEHDVDHFGGTASVDRSDQTRATIDSKLSSAIRIGKLHQVFPKLNFFPEFPWLSQRQSDTESRVNGGESERADRVDDDIDDNLDIQCFEATVSAGDMIYYPSGWWHQTLNLDTVSVAISGSVVGKQSLRAFAEVLRAECLEIASPATRAVTSSRYKLDEELCRHLASGCFGKWYELSE